MSEIRFGSYRIAGTLGSGAISTIYKAVQEPLGRKDASSTMIYTHALKRGPAGVLSLADELPGGST